MVHPEQRFLVYSPQRSELRFLILVGPCPEQRFLDDDDDDDDEKWYLPQRSELRFLNLVGPCPEQRFLDDDYDDDQSETCWPGKICVSVPYYMLVPGDRLHLIMKVMFLIKIIIYSFNMILEIIFPIMQLRLELKWLRTFSKIP